jgi:hypothetical protein
VLPGGECEFAGQLRQEPTVEAARVAEYVPAPQSVHAAEPMSFLYVPATHAEQDPPSDPVNPRLQRQLVERMLPMADTEFDEQLAQVEDAVAPVVVENLPAMQSVHTTEPFSALYFPATHAKHVPPSGPQYPASQLQAVAAVCPITESPEFALQAVQAAEPLSGLYVSAAHAEHRSPYAPV